MVMNSAGDSTAKATVKSWDEAPYDEADGTPKTSKARISYGYEGDITGEGSAELLMVYVGESAEFVGIERVNATIDGRPGTFVVSIIGGFADGAARWSWEVVAGSATGELEGLRLAGRAQAPSGKTATLTFEHELA